VSDNKFSPSNPTSRLDKRQEPPRRDIVGGSVTSDERTRILGAFEQAGFGTISEGVRVICLAHADSAAVRDAVAAWRRANPAEAA
jgi:hypothetical protein